MLVNFQTSYLISFQTSYLTNFQTTYLINFQTSYHVTLHIYSRVYTSFGKYVFKSSVLILPRLAVTFLFMCSIFSNLGPSDLFSPLGRGTILVVTNLGNKEGYKDPQFISWIRIPIVNTATVL